MKVVTVTRNLWHLLGDDGQAIGFVRRTPAGRYTARVDGSEEETIHDSPEAAAASLRAPDAPTDAPTEEKAPAFSSRWAALEVD